jgi:hypothetical protein
MGTTATSWPIFAEQDHNQPRTTHSGGCSSRQRPNSAKTWPIRPPVHQRSDPEIANGLGPGSSRPAGGRASSPLEPGPCDTTGARAYPRRVTARPRCSRHAKSAQPPGRRMVRLGSPACAGCVYRPSSGRFMPRTTGSARDRHSAWPPETPGGYSATSWRLYAQLDWLPSNGEGDPLEALIGWRAAFPPARAGSLAIDRARACAVVRGG